MSTRTFSARAQARCRRSSPRRHAGAGSIPRPLWWVIWKTQPSEQVRSHRSPFGARSKPGEVDKDGGNRHDWIRQLFDRFPTGYAWRLLPAELVPCDDLDD
ncbi:hypothetical protein ABZW96_07890 [Nocardia sp. NPDC004168]|uniref:hypothetical protein n=1 Tax=Nocardia sp. NPDC004168 TaxID=3154452 RepID=UPI0033B377C8